MSEDKKLIGALPPGAVIGSPKQRYKVEAVLGAGGFGITYKVVRMSDGRVFAMKEYFRKELCERDDNMTLSYLKSNKEIIENGVEDFITEAKRLDKQNIVHPNIVAIDEVFKANNTAYYVMEFVAGADLLHYIKRHRNVPLSQEQALSVIRPVLQAVDLLHRNSITHLDIKHENILLTQEADGSMRPVLIDFGLSKHYDKKGKATSTLTAAGCTDGFAPPEQYQGLTTFTPQADVYALAATLLYLLTAQWPVKSSEISAKKIIDSLPDSVSERIQDALVKALRKDKDDRTQSVGQFAAELGLDISERIADGNVTRLLELGKKKKSHAPVDLRRFVKPALWALGASAVVAGAILLFENLPSGGGTTEDAEQADSTMVAGDDASIDSVNAVLPGDPQDNATVQSEGKASETAPAVSEPVKPKPDEAPSTAKPDEKKQEPAAAKHAADDLDAQFASARTLQDFQALASKNYVKAYAPLAEKYLQARKYDQANQYLRMAAAAGVGTAQARRVAETLRASGYYDDPANGQYPF